MQTQRRFWKGFQQYNVVNFVVSSCIVGALVLHFTDATPSVAVEKARAQSAVLSECVHPVSLESVQSSKQSTLVASMQHTSIKLNLALMEGKPRIQQPDADLTLFPNGQRCISGNASQNSQGVDIAKKVSIAANAPLASAVPDSSEVLAREAMPAIHFVSQKRTIPVEPLLSASHSFLGLVISSTLPSASMLQGSAYNVFPYGQCTWWANQRYYQLYGYFVPWTTNANAFQWVDRARDFGWHVSGTPVVGSIMVLQPYVDGAYGFGHVGVVEQILTNGSVIASSMNWGNHPGMVTQAPYVLGPGVSFISRY